MFLEHAMRRLGRCEARSGIPHRDLSVVLDKVPTVLEGAVDFPGGGTLVAKGDEADRA